MWQPTHVKVTVKQARSLLTKGKNGTNDAFVVIGIGKEKYQTSIKEKSLPTVEWREECELAIPSQGNKANIQLTVYHHNGIGLDEFLGLISLPLADFDVYEKPKYRSYKLKGKPEKDKKKGEKERGELEVMINFIVKSGSYLDISKKEKQKSSLTSLKHLGGSLMSIGAKEKQGLKNFAKSVSSKMDKIAKPKRRKSKTPSENSAPGLSNDLMASQQRYGDADPGVISDDDEDDFKFDDDVKVNTRTSSPLSTMSRGSSLMHDHVLDTDFEFGSYEDPEHDFSYSFGKPPRIVDKAKESRRTSPEKITSFSDPDPFVQIKVNTPELSRTVIEEEPFSDLKDKPWDLQKTQVFDIKEEEYSDFKEEPDFMEIPKITAPMLQEPEENMGTIDLGPPIELQKRLSRWEIGGLHPEEPKDSFSSARSFGESNTSYYSPNEEKSFYSVGDKREVAEQDPNVRITGPKIENFMTSSANNEVQGKKKSSGIHIIEDTYTNELKQPAVKIIEKKSYSEFYKDEVLNKENKKANEIVDDVKQKNISVTQDSINALNDGQDSAISLSNDPDSIISSALSSRPRSNSNASSVLSSASETKDFHPKSAVPPYLTESSPRTLLKSQSDLEILLRQGSAGKKSGKRIISGGDPIELGDSQIIRSGSLSERRPSVGAQPTSAALGTPPTMIDEWERKLYGRSGMTGSAENVSITGSRSSLNTSRESSIHDIRKEDNFTRLPEVKALTLEKIYLAETEDDSKKQKRKNKTGFKNRFFNKSGGSREKLNEDSRYVEGGNDRLPSIPSRTSKLPQEVHDKFAGKSREDLLEVILNLQASLEQQVKHSNDLEEYIDNLLLRVMEATPHILQTPLKTGPVFKGY